jgi:hypothetical protein
MISCAHATKGPSNFLPPQYPRPRPHSRPFGTLVIFGSSTTITAISDPHHIRVLDHNHGHFRPSPYPGPRPQSRPFQTLIQPLWLTYLPSASGPRGAKGRPWRFRSSFAHCCQPLPGFWSIAAIASALLPAIRLLRDHLPLPGSLPGFQLARRRGCRLGDYSNFFSPSQVSAGRYLYLLFAI